MTPDDRPMGWFARNSESIEAAAAVLTAIVALAALIGVSFQLDAADRLQREQSAREAYRGHLVLAASMPHFAQPADACALVQSDQAGAYAAFVDHLLYSAEQMLAVSAGWQETFLVHLDIHRGYLCSADAPMGETEETAALLRRFRADACGAAPGCP